MSLPQAIILTLKYSAHFSFPLTEEEIYCRLIKCRSTRHTLKSELTKMLVQGKLKKTKGYYHLPQNASFVANRLKQEQLSRPLCHRARILSSQLFSLPGILAFYLTGSLAVGNSGDDGDIDLLVLTYPKVLWSTRFLLTLTTSLFGLRRTRRSRRNRGKLCLNLYLTPDSLTVPVNRRSLYTAYELIQTTPLYDPHHTYPHLLLCNSWIKEYLPNFPLPRSLSPLHLRPISLLSIFEPLFFSFQYSYMKHHITRELITPNSAYFHPNNPGSKVLGKLGVK